MNQKEWYTKLEEWAFDDARLHRLPLALLPALAEHLANHEADVLVRCVDCGALIETTVHCDNCGSFHPTRGLR